MTRRGPDLLVYDAGAALAHIARPAAFYLMHCSRTLGVCQTASADSRLDDKGNFAASSNWLLMLRTAGLSSLAVLGSPLLFVDPGGSAGSVAVVVALVVVSAYSASKSTQLDWRTVVGVYLGMAIAVVANTQFKLVYRDAHGSLLLPGIAFMWVFGSIPVTVGLLLGRWLYQFRRPPVL